MAPSRREYKLPGKRWIGLSLCIFAAVMQLTLSPSSRMFLTSAVASSRAASISIRRPPKGIGARARGVAKNDEDTASSSLSMEGSTWGSKMSDFFASFAGTTSSTTREGHSALGDDSSSGGVTCKGGSVGPALDYTKAVKRYLALPWTMRREGARHTGGSLSPVLDSNYTCFKSPYAIGGPLDAPCKMEDHIFYPKAPKERPALPGVPDLSKEKLARCTAFKRYGKRVLKEHTRHIGGPNSTVQKEYANKNITCGPEQLCFYPPEMPSGQGGFVEAVNTELGVEVCAAPVVKASLHTMQCNYNTMR